MNIWRIKIPTIFGFILLIIGVIGGVYLVQKKGIWFLKAAPEAIPKQVKITNLSENSFTVSWTTDGEITGFVKYGESSSLEKTARDERDELSGTTTPFFTHYVKISNLQPATKYFFKIGSGRKLFDNRGRLYEVTTAPVLGTPPAADTAYGTVVAPGGSPAAGAIVYLTLANSTLLSSLTKADGQWAIPLSVARTNHLNAYITYDRETSLEEIFVQGGHLGTSTAIANTQNDSPLPPITLGEIYDFRQTPSPTPAGGKFSLESLKTPPQLSERVAITNPEANEEVATQKPEIRGTGPANQKIKIVIESDEVFSDEVMVDENGNWRWTPPDNLSPGKHKITVSLKDGTTISHSFIVLAAEGDFPAFTSTPSATITPSPTGTITPSPTATPTVIPTVTPALIVTTTPSKGISAADEAVPQSGYLTPTLGFVILGVVMILASLFIKPRPHFDG